MATKKPLILVSGVPTQYTPPTTSAGSGNAGDIPGLNATGQLDVSFMPTGIGPEVVLATTSDTLTAGMFVNLYDLSSASECRKAVAADTTKPAHGFVLAGSSIAGSATVYCSGLNTLVPLGTFTIANLGATVWLDPSTSGSCTVTPPSTSGQLQQPLGTIVAVGTTVTVQFGFNQGYAM